MYYLFEDYTEEFGNWLKTHRKKTLKEISNYLVSKGNFWFPDDLEELENGDACTLYLDLVEIMDEAYGFNGEFDRYVRFTIAQGVIKDFIKEEQLEEFKGTF